MKDMFPIRMKRTPAEKEAIYALPFNMQYEIVCVNLATHCRVWKHVLVNPTARDYWQVYAVAIAYTEECDCWINPEVVPQAENGRKKLYPGITDNANPDLTTRYGFVDVKSPESKNNIVSNANMACKQGGIVVITDLAMKESLNMDDVDKSTARIFSDKNVDQTGKPNYTKNEVHWLVNGRIIKCNRPRKN